MVSRLASAAFFALVAASTNPASSREAETFAAWGHTFNVPFVRATAVNDAAAFGDPAPATGSVPVRSAYASTEADAAPQNASTADAQGGRTLNVWGARVSIPAY